MADSVSSNYDKFVVIAEDNWKLYGEEVTKTCGHVHENGVNLGIGIRPARIVRSARAGVSRRTPAVGAAATYCTQNSTTKFTVSFAGYEWECTFTDRKTIKLKCSAKVNLELVLFDDKHNALEKFPIRVNSDCWSYACGSVGSRQWPDFTSANVQIGHLKSNCQLWVGGQVFHVNKELLCMYSPYFDRMFNGSFQEANKDEVKLDTETADPALFHDFLLFMTFPSGDYQILPNRMNVAGLLQLAVFYQVDLLKKKCEYFLENCHEMPILERIRATKKMGVKELQKRLLAKFNFNTVEAWEEFFLEHIDN